MRKPRNSPKTHGYIVVPVYAENSDTASLDEAIKGEGFDNVALILGALLEQDEELVDIIRELRQDKGQGKPFNPQRLKEKLELVGRYVQLEALTNSICITTVNQLGSSWDEWYGLLVEFKERKGHCLVPQRHIEREKKLGVWVNGQRSKFAELNLDQIKKLDELNFSWDPQQEKWELGFEKLVEYVNTYNTCVMPAKFKTLDNYKLGSWVTVQRATRDNLPLDRKKRLESLKGWSWDLIDDRWDQCFNALREYSESHGSCVVSKDIKLDDGRKLWMWVINQRMRRKILTAEQKSKLDSLSGWSWNPKDAKWEEGFNALTSYVVANKTAVVPYSYRTDDGIPLGEWVYNQRKRREVFSQDRIKRLEALPGWVWNLNKN
jgi:hypothetical protein